MIKDYFLGIVRMVVAVLLIPVWLPLAFSGNTLLLEKIMGTSKDE